MKMFNKLHQFWVHLRKLFSKQRKLYLLVIAGLITLSFVATFFILSSKSASVSINPLDVVKIEPTPEPAPEPIKYYSPLTGSLVKTEADTNKAVTAVMIENSPDARPQSGLKDSGVVFEAIAEGGITRFMVLYQQEKPKLIGPVRSVRLYDVEWLAAFNASLAHVGGSYYGLIELRNGSYRDIDQFFNPGSYWRANERYAPHNVYTNFENLDALNKSKGYNSSKFTGFTRTNGVVSTKLDATSISINVSSATYNSSYVFNKKSNNYTRYQAGAIHKDRESGNITPSVVIAMYVNESTIFEDGYREKIITIGSGKAYIFQNGTVKSVTWKKSKKTAQITFTDKNGKDVPLVRGQTWITAVPNDDGSVSWK